MLQLCSDNHVELVVSLNDLELPQLAQMKPRFAEKGIQVVVSSPEVIDICFDKHKTYQFALSNNIATAATFTNIEKALEAIQNNQLSFPLIVKPRWGSASIGIDIVNDKEELELCFRLAFKKLERTFLANVSKTDFENSILIQECLTGIEYGLDVVNDLAGNYVCTFVREKLAMRAGETDRAKVIHHTEIEQFGKKLGKTLKHVGNLDCDLFINKHGFYLLEMNPRFGGGYPFSQTAGANIPAALIAWANNQTTNPDWFKTTPTTAAKCDRLVRVGPERSE